MADHRDYTFEITAPSEDRHREFKCSEVWDKLKYKIARAALAMANLRDGGHIIIGVEDNGTGCVASGMTDVHFNTYEDDKVKSYINQFADPYISCSIHRPVVQGKQFIVIEVAEFDELPVICKKATNDEENRPALQRGGIYSRSYEKPESCLVQSQNELREILNGATERGIRKFLALAGQAGVSLHAQPTDAEKYGEEAGEFEKRIMQSNRFASGHYLFAIRPTSYNAQAVQPISRALEVVNQHEVRWFGWNFPLIVRHEETVEQCCAGSPGRLNGWGEFWRFFQSGNFLYAVAYRHDRPGRNPSEHIDRRSEILRPDGFEHRGIIDFHDLIILATLEHEFAARLAKALSWNESAEISMTLTDTVDRVVVSTDVARPLGRFWRATAPKVESRQVVSITDLLSRPRQFAAEAAYEILQRFAGTQIALANVVRDQESLFGNWGSNT